MVTVETIGRIRRAFLVDHKPIRQIVRELRISRKTRDSLSVPRMPKGRCRIHGGRSPRAPRGDRNGRWRGGFYTAEAQAARRRLIDECGDTPASVMLIDRAVAAYQDFIRISGWTGNTALMVEHEFFGADRPLPQFRDRQVLEGRQIRGLTVEEYINRLGQDLT